MAEKGFVCEGERSNRDGKENLQMNQPAERKFFSLKRLASWMPILLFGFAVAFSIFTAYFYSLHLLDSDASSELVLANLLARQGALLSTDWYYSNEIRLLQTNLIFAPLFTIFSDWHTVRFVGTVIMQGLLLLSYGYVCRQMKLSKRAFFCTATILILPFSVPYGRIVLFHTYYLPYCILGFLLVGLFLSAVHHSGKSFSAGQWLRVACGILLSFGSGLTGVRQLMSTLVPLLIVTAFLILNEDKKPEATEKKAKKFAMLLAFCMLLAGGVGFVINNEVLSKVYSLRVFDEIKLSFADAEDMMNMLLAYLKQFGFQTERRLLSLGGMLACGSLFVAIYLAVSGWGFLKRPDRAAMANGYARVFFPVAVLLMMGIFVFTQGNQHYILYFLPVIIWGCPMLAALLDEEIFSERFHLKTISLRQLSLLLSVMLLFANGCYNNLFFLDPDDKLVAYEGLGWQETDTIYRLEGVVEFLEENEYTHGYASFWNANIVAELTNGKVSMSGIILVENAMVYHDWLSVKHYREREYAEQQTPFLLLTHGEVDAFMQTTPAEAAYDVYYDDFYVIYEFENPLEMWEHLDG